MKYVLVCLLIVGINSDCILSETIDGCDIESNLASDKEINGENRGYNQSSESIINLLPSGNWITESFLVNIKNEQCRRHLEEVSRNLVSLDLWAFKMYDSNGKIPSALLSGNTHQLGDFDQCIHIHHKEIKGKFCLALIDVNAKPTVSDSIRELVEKIRGDNFVQSHRSDPGHFVPTYTTLKWGLCIPQSCQATDVMTSLNSYFNTSLQYHPLSIQSNIDEQFCETYESYKREWPYYTHLTIIIFGSLVILCLVSTYLDINSTPVNKLSKYQRCLLLFSLKRNWRQFYTYRKEEIGCLHGLRSISTVMLFFAHNTIPLSSMPFINRNKFAEICFAPFGSLFRSSIVYTDTFLFLSGLLSSYYLQNSSWKARFGNRLLRMIPAHLIVVIFSIHIWPYMNSGPLWSYIVKTNSQLCSEGWWKNLLHIHNFFPFEKMCAPHTYQLALDLQLFLITLPLVIGLKSHPVPTSIAMFLFNIVSAYLRYSTVIDNELSLVVYTGARLEDMYKAANYSYIRPLHRASSYLCGVWLGFLLYHIKFHSIKFSKSAVYIGWSSTIASLTYCLLANYNVGAKTYKYDSLEAARYAAFSSLLTSVALCWIVLACFTGHGGFVNKFLSSRGMVLLSRISYSVYLVQFCVFFYNLGSVKSSQTFSLSHLVPIDHFSIVVLVAILMTLMIDIPMQNFKNIILR